MNLKKKHSFFISSTYEDLKQERQAVIDAALDNNIIPVGMEQFHAAPASQWDVITKMIDGCDGYLLIVAGRYGSIDDAVGISYTEKEYNYAKNKKLPVWVLIRDKSGITADKMDNDDPRHTKQEKQALLEAFIERVKDDNNTVAFFKDIKDLKYEAAQAFVNSTEFFSEDSGWVRYSDVKKLNVKDLIIAEESHHAFKIDNVIESAELGIIGDSLDAYGTCDSKIGKFFLSISKYLEEKGVEYSKEGDENINDSYLVTKGLKFKYCKAEKILSDQKVQCTATAIMVSIAASGFSDSLSLLLELLRLYKGDGKRRIVLHLNPNYGFVRPTEEASSIICSSDGFRLNRSQLNSYIYTRFGLVFSVRKDESRKLMPNSLGGIVSIEFDNKSTTQDEIIELIERLVEIGFIQKSFINNRS